MSPTALLRPVDPDAVLAAVAALVATGTTGAIAVVDLDRLHLLTPGDEHGPRALGRALELTGTHLRGRAPWLRLADDVLVVLAPGLPTADEADALAADLLACLTGPEGVAAPGLPWSPVVGVAWSPEPATDLLARALEQCWHARHRAPAVAPTAATTTRPDTTRPDTTRPGTTRPDTTRPDSTRPDSTRPDGTGAAARRVPAGRPVPVPVEPAVPAPPSAFDDFLVAISSRALGLDPAEFVASLDDVLAELVAVVGADYAFVDVLAPDGRTVVNLGGATAPGHDGFVRAEPRELDADDPWRHMLTELVPVAVDDQFATHDGEHPANHPLGCAARSFLTVPFVVGGALAGAVGLGCVDRPRTWTAADINGARLTTGLVAAVLERDRLRRERSA